MLLDMWSIEVNEFQPQDVAPMPRLHSVGGISGSVAPSSCRQRLGALLHVENAFHG